MDNKEWRFLFLILIVWIVCIAIISIYNLVNSNETKTEIINTNSKCYGVIKDIIIEEKQTKIITPKGIFIFDEDGQLIQQKVK